MFTTGGGLRCWLIGCAALALPSAAARADEVQWRLDYNRARQEAGETGRLIVIDIGTENCYWCRQLEARTFRDPAVVALLNERCVPLRIDAQRSPALAEALHIQSYPTLVFASADGRILGFQEGFVEAAPFREQVGRALAAVAAPDWMLRDYQEAVKAHGGGDLARTVSLLKNIVEDGRDRPVQARARQLLQEVEQQAAERLARGRKLADQGQVREAVEVLTEMVSAYAGTVAAREGSRLLLALTSRNENNDQRARRARDLLAQAREDYRTQQFLCCLDRCELLSVQFADLPEGAEAGQLAADIKSNPEWARQAADQLSDRLGILYLALADSSLKKGQPQEAIVYLERVVQQFPRSRHAEAAQGRLLAIQGQPGGRGGDIKK
jgi:thioredoxin-related protein